MLHDYFYSLGNLWSEPLCLEENTEGTQGLGHFLSLEYILKTGLAMQDIGTCHSLEKQREKNAQSFFRKREHGHKLSMKEREISIFLLTKLLLYFFWVVHERRNLK